MRTIVPPISAADLARVASRHREIPQDALPIGDIPAAAIPTKEGLADKAPKSIKWKQCPHHAPSGKKQMTGLILDGKRLVFREHRKSIGKLLVLCPGSGTEWIEDGA